MNRPSSEDPPRPVQAPPPPHAQGHFALCSLSGITIYPSWGRVNGVIYALTDLGIELTGRPSSGRKGIILHLGSQCVHSVVGGASW